MQPIINTRRLREDHPSIGPGWLARMNKRKAHRKRKGTLWAFVMTKARLLQLIQEIRELHADVPPPIGKLEVRIPHAQHP